MQGEKTVLSAFLNGETDIRFFITRTKGGRTSSEVVTEGVEDEEGREGGRRKVKKGKGSKKKKKKSALLVYFALVFLLLLDLYSLSHSLSLLLPRSRSPR